MIDDGGMARKGGKQELKVTVRCAALRCEQKKVVDVGRCRKQVRGWS